MLIRNAVFPTTAQMASRPDDEGPVVMLSLLKFKPRATYGNDRADTGRGAFAHYAAGFRDLLRQAGGRVIYLGSVRRLRIGDADEPWDAISLVEYPSASAFEQLAGLAQHRGLDVHRIASVAGQLNIETTPWRV